MQGASPPDSPLAPTGSRPAPSGPPTPAASPDPVGAPLTLRRWGARSLAPMVVAAVTVTGWAALVTPLGDVSGHYTDHLRHMGEALAILQSGFEPYRLPYAEATAHLELPCPAHAGLWGDQVSLYPPLGLLLHAPVALLERGGFLSPLRAHQLMGLLWLLVGLAALAALWALTPRAPVTARVGLAVVGAPLLLGTGANGFFDVAFVLAAALALLAMQRGRWALATVLFAAAGALHFRAAVLLPFALLAAWRAAAARPRRFVVAALVCGALLAPSLYAAGLVARFAAAIPAHNPAHFARHGPSFWVAVVACSVAAVAAWRVSRASSVAFLLAGLLLALDPMHAWWHALIILLPVVSFGAARSRLDSREWAMAWLWCLGLGFAVFRHPLGPFWQWVAFAAGASHS